ncbi:MAG: hypothetical protein ABSA53_35010 [Streptosporangiaceae bacterium]
MVDTAPRAASSPSARRANPRTARAAEGRVLELSLADGQLAEGHAISG